MFYVMLQASSTLAFDGCNNECACDESGTLPEEVHRCERLGGKCKCKDNVGVLLLDNINNIVLR